MQQLRALGSTSTEAGFHPAHHVEVALPAGTPAGGLAARPGPGVFARDMH